VVANANAGKEEDMVLFASDQYPSACYKNRYQKVGIPISHASDIHFGTEFFWY